MSKTAPTFLVALILSFSLFFLMGCTEGPGSPPYTTSQFISRSTDLNYNLFLDGNYANMLLYIDSNSKFDVTDFNGEFIVGPIGPVGPQGPQGEQGVPGQDGSGIDTNLYTAGIMSFDTNAFLVDGNFFDKNVSANCYSMLDGNVFCGYNDIPSNSGTGIDTNCELNNSCENIVYNYNLLDKNCYQESSITVNQSGTDGNCTLNYAGSLSYTNPGQAISLSNRTDGDWDTYSRANLYELNRQVSVYAKPINAVSAIWKSKFDRGRTGAPSIYTVEYNIPNECMERADNNLVLWLDDYLEGYNYSSLDFYCLDNADNNILIAHVEPDSVACDNKIYEEAVIWVYEGVLRNYLTDAPSDGNQYARQNEGWSIVTSTGGGVGDGNIYSLGIMDRDTNSFLIDINTGSKNVDTNFVYANVIWADQNRGYGTMYCVDGNIVMGYLVGYSC